MVGIVVAAHGDVAPALLHAAEAIVGPMENARALTLQAGADPAAMQVALRDAFRMADSGDGVLVLCDMFGGTPANVCLTCLPGEPLEVVTGINLPMLLKVASLRASGLRLEELAAEITAYGQRNITHASRLMRERRAARTAAAPPMATAAAMQTAAPPVAASAASTDALPAKAAQPAAGSR